MVQEELLWIQPTILSPKPESPHPEARMQVGRGRTAGGYVRGRVSEVNRCVFSPFRLSRP